jgi:GNAT superfamily N-acetyltransferase
VAVYNNQLVGFIAVIQSMGHVGMKIIHRMVVLPDYQGIGIGTNLLNYVGEKYKQNKMMLNIVSSNPSIYHALKQSDKWMLLRIGRVSASTNKAKRKTDSVKRVTFTFQYK